MPIIDPSGTLRGSLVVSEVLQRPGHDGRRKHHRAGDDGAVLASTSDARAKGKVIQH
jgi:hypothetical protein